MSEEIVLSAGTVVLGRVDSLIEKLCAAEKNLEGGYAKLGALLTEVSEKGYWRGEYESWTAYMEHLGKKYNKGRTQLYQYFSTVKELKPYVTEDDLNGMGIAKATELCRSAKRTGFPPTAEVIRTAADPKVTVAAVHKLLFETDNPKTEAEEKSTFMDIGGFYVSQEERLVINSAFEAAWRTDPVVKQGLPERIRFKEAVLRMSMEYLAEHAESDSFGGDA